MATLTSLAQGESFSIAFNLPIDYDMNRIESIKIYIGGIIYPHQVIDRTIRCELMSEDTNFMLGLQKIVFWVDGFVYGVRKLYVGDINVLSTTAIAYNPSINEGDNLIIILNITETIIEVTDILFNYLKGYSAYQLWALEPPNIGKTYAEFEAWLQQPATDAATTINAEFLLWQAEEALRVADENIRLGNESNRVIAEGLRVTAEGLRVIAESDRDSAEGLREIYETARRNNEFSRNNNESARIISENLRISQESARVISEGLRVTEEGLRVIAENGRVAAESDRVIAEGLRVTEEGLRVTAEGLRVTAESNRVTAEGLRVIAEGGRVTAEGLRVIAESARVTAEGLRVIAENARVTAEGLRVIAEAARVAAELLRVAAESARNIAANVYNVTVEIPLGAGLYYTLTTAIAAIPVGIRRIGFEITFRTAVSTWVTYQFVGADTSTWSTLGNWILEVLPTQVQATETINGYVSLTNSTEAANALDDTKAMTALKSYFASRLNHPQYTDNLADLDLGAFKLYSGGMIVPKTASSGIKVDTVLPTFGYRDLVGQIFPSTGGAAAPAFTALRGTNVKNYAFAVNDRIDSTIFHLPHDYVPNSTIYLHIHWSHNGTAISGNFDLEYYVLYSKGYNQVGQVFNSELTIPQTITGITSVTTHPRWGHFINEFALSSAGGDATHLDTALLEVDGLIEVALKVTAIPTITGSVTSNLPYIKMIDVHYQSNGILGTKDKNFPFYV